MRAVDAINYIDETKPNSVSTQKKVGWLITLDTMIWQEQYLTHKLPEVNGETVTFDPDSYNEDTELLVGEPYSEMYIHWLEAKIDYENAEYTRYNNSVVRFNDYYQEFCKYYNRTHMPNGKKIKF